jgi:hypothetical protein
MNKFKDGELIAFEHFVKEKYTRYEFIGVNCLKLKVGENILDKISGLEKRIADIESQLLLADEGLEFYGSANNWYAVTIKDKPKMMIDDLYLWDKYEDYYCHKGGKRAKGARATIRETVDEIRGREK